MAKQTDVTKATIDPVTGQTVGGWVKVTTPEKRNETYNLLLIKMDLYDQTLPDGSKVEKLTEGEWGVLAYGIFRDAEVINMGGPTKIWENGGDLNMFLDFVDHVYEPVVNTQLRRTPERTYTNPLTGTAYKSRSYWLSAMGDSVRTEGWQLPLTTGAFVAGALNLAPALGAEIVWSGASGFGAMLASGGAGVVGLGTAAAAAKATAVGRVTAQALMGLDKLVTAVTGISGGWWVSRIATGFLATNVALTAASMWDNAFHPEANEEAEAAAEIQARGLDQPGATVRQGSRGAGDQARPVIEVLDAKGKIIDVQYGVLATGADGSPVIYPETSQAGSFVPDQTTGGGFSFVPTGGTTSAGFEPPGIAGTEPTDPLIRVREGYLATRRVFAEPMTRENLFTAQTGPRYKTVSTQPQYRDSHVIPTLRAMNDEEIHAFQLMMVDAGLIGEFDYFPGVRDAATETAMYEVMGQANVDGEQWQTSARFYQELGRRQKELAKKAALKARTFVQPAYVVPDYAYLSQAVKQTFDLLVGRKPHDYELALLADQMNADYRKQYQAEVAAQRAEFDAQGRAIVDETSQTAGTVQGVDPAARLMEAIETKYRGEIEGEEAEDRSLVDVSNILNSFSRMTAFTRGA